MNTAVCVLVINKEEYSFLSVSLKEDHEDFNLPGGKLEDNETLEEAGIREVKEETGIDICDLKFLMCKYRFNHCLMSALPFSCCFLPAPLPAHDSKS